jgi:hypothetical protein
MLPAWVVNQYGRQQKLQVEETRMRLLVDTWTGLILSATTAATLHAAASLLQLVVAL